MCLVYEFMLVSRACIITQTYRTTFQVAAGSSTQTALFHKQFVHVQVELLRQMMVYEPEKRISAVKALQHSFFNPPTPPEAEKAASPAAAAAAALVAT